MIDFSLFAIFRILRSFIKDRLCGELNYFYVTCIKSILTVTLDHLTIRHL